MYHMIVLSSKKVCVRAILYVCFVLFYFISYSLFLSGFLFTLPAKLLLMYYFPPPLCFPIAQLRIKTEYYSLKSHTALSIFIKSGIWLMCFVVLPI